MSFKQPMRLFDKLVRIGLVVFCLFVAAFCFIDRPIGDIKSIFAALPLAFIGLWSVIKWIVVGPNVFHSTHSYRSEPGTVYVDSGSGEPDSDFKIRDVRLLRGMTEPFRKRGNRGVLEIIYGRGIKTTSRVFRSLPDKSIEGFDDTDLMPLFELILYNNPNLQKADDSDFHYKAE